MEWGLNHLWGLLGHDTLFLAGWERIVRDRNLSWGSKHSMYCQIVAYICAQWFFSSSEYMRNICPVSPSGAWCKVLQYIL